MLKAHQAIIDLKKNALIIQGREVPFLPEHEIPDKGRDMPIDEDVAGGPSTAGPSVGGSVSTPASRAGVVGGPQQQQGSFPSGAGRTLGSAPAGSFPGTPAAAGRGGAPARPAGQPPQSRFPEEHIQTIMGFGVTRAVAISTLEAAGGNLDVAASLLF